MSAQIHELTVTYLTFEKADVLAYGATGPRRFYKFEAESDTGEIVLTIREQDGIPPKLGDRIRIRIEKAE